MASKTRVLCLIFRFSNAFTVVLSNQLQREVIGVSVISFQSCYLLLPWFLLTSLNSSFENFNCRIN